MSERETPNIGGYEWGFQCECDTYINLSGMSGASAPNIDHRKRTLYDGDEIECPDCGRVTTVTLESDDGD